ncbi:hypothetical protein JTB14_033788 [Gonioctena quinquepunctata]|nr:hypothetical protein JTB14_033788 [Gonioctena quinquepunctata]
MGGRRPERAERHYEFGNIPDKATQVVIVVKYFGKCQAVKVVRYPGKNQKVDGQKKPAGVKLLETTHRIRVRQEQDGIVLSVEN